MGGCVNTTAVYQPFHTRSGVSSGFRQWNSHVAVEPANVVVQKQDLVVHYTIAFEVHYHWSRYS